MAITQDDDFYKEPLSEKSTKKIHLQEEGKFKEDHSSIKIQGDQCIQAFA